MVITKKKPLDHVSTKFVDTLYVVSTDNDNGNDSDHIVESLC